MTRTSPRQLSGRWLAFAFLLLAAGIGALWYSAISAHEAAVLRERGRELQAIAELKIEFIRFWLDERRSDALVQSRRPLLAIALTGHDADKWPYGLAALPGQLEAIRKEYGYEAVMLLDHKGAHGFSAGSVPDYMRTAAAQAARTSMTEGRVVVSRAYHAESDGRWHIDIDIAVPVVSSRPVGTQTVGSLVFHLDPREHLDPFLKQWPAPSESGETFLFERSGDEIVYLSSLRHADAATMRRRVDDSALPAALAARGGQGVVEGLDYRGVPVLAAVGQVPGMPWFVVSKLDREEVLAPVRRETLWSGTLASLLVMALGLATLSWYRRGQSELALTQQIAAQAALTSSEARFRKLIENAWDLLVLFDRDMRIVYASPSVEQQLGGRLTGESIASGTALVHPADVGLVEAARVKALAHPGLPQRFEHRVRGRYDHWMIVEANFTNHFDDPDIGALTYIGRDISERIWAAQELRDSEERYRFLFKLSPDAVFLHRHGVIFQTNDAAVRLFRAGSENALIGRHWGKLVVPERWPFVAQRIAALESGEQAYLQPSEQHYLALDGQAIDVEATGARIVIDGKPAIMSVVRDISERKRTEAALRESEARLQAIIEHAPLGIAIVNAKGRYTMVNPAQCRILGYSETELIGKSFRDFTHSDDADLNEEMALEMIQGRMDHFTLEKRYLRKDGQTIWVVLSVSAVRDENGALRYFIGLLQDITERKWMEQTLRESEARYRFLFAGCPLPMWVYDLETLAFIEVNDAAIAHYGYTREEFQSMTLRDMVPPERVEAMEAALRQPDEVRWGRIWTHRLKDGSRIEVAVWSRSLDYAGRPARMVLTEDVTERIRAQAALTDSEERYRILFELSPDAVFVHRNFSILYANNAALRLFGAASAQDLVGKDWHGLLSREDWPIAEQRVASLTSSETSTLQPSEQHFVTLDGRAIQVEAASARIVINGEPAIMSVFRDITARKLAEAALRESEETLRIFLDALPSAAFLVRRDDTFGIVNAATAHTLKRPRESLVGSNAYALMPAEAAARRKAWVDEVTATGQERVVEENWRDRWYESRLAPVIGDSGEVMGVAVTTADITERKEGEKRRIELAHQQRDTLVREVHHRIKNHLQGLAGLLRQHMHEQPELEPVLKKFAAQINAISIVHGLQGRTEQGDASLRNLITEIAAFLGGITGAPVSLNCPAHGCMWAVAEAEAVPLALILNELLTNALRHGTDKAQVSLDIRCDGDRAQLIIKNPGHLGAGLDFAGGKGLGTGLSLIRSLLPPEGTTLSLENTEEGWVETRLELGPPVLHLLVQPQVVSLR